MKKVLFLCHGNICRSPMAEFIFKDMTERCDISIESMAVSDEEMGKPIYPRASETLRRHGVAHTDHRSRRVTRTDYDVFDYVIVMEEYNTKILLDIIGKDDGNKVRRLLDFTDHPGDIEDPWYSGNFEKVYSQIKEGCGALLEHMRSKGEIKEKAAR